MAGRPGRLIPGGGSSGSAATSAPVVAGGYWPMILGASTAVNTRGDAFLYVVPFTMTVAKIAAFLSTITSGNFDAGIYDSAGTTKLASSGSVPASGSGFTSGAVNEITLSTPVLLLPGTYWVAISSDGAGAAYRIGGSGVNGKGKFVGSAQVPLPSSIAGWSSNPAGPGPVLVGG